MPPQHTALPTPDKTASFSSDAINLSTSLLPARAHPCQESDRAQKVRDVAIDEIGPHVELLKALEGMEKSYQPVPADEPRCPDQRRLNQIQEQACARISQRGHIDALPQGVRIIDLIDVLAGQASAMPIRDFKEFLDRAGVKPGKTSYLKFPDGTYSAIRRRVLDNRNAADEVVWVDTFAAVGHLHNLSFSPGGTTLSQPIPYDVRGFFDPDARIAVMPSIPKRNGRSLSEWRAEALIVLQTAVHELEHGRGGGEYQARAASDAYLHRIGVMPTAGDPEARLKMVSLGWYCAEEYSAAVGDSMRDLKTYAIIAPARLPDPRVEREFIPMLASVSLGAFSSNHAMVSGDGADVVTYGLTAEVSHPKARRICVRHEGPSGSAYRWVGSLLTDRILQQAVDERNFALRIAVAEAISDRIAHEAMRIAALCNLRDPTSSRISDLADGVAANFEPGDVHLALRDYVSRRGGAAVLPRGKDTVWINSLPQGVVLRDAGGVTILFASSIHRGAALRIPLKDGDSYGDVAARVRVFERDSDEAERLFARRRGRVLWESTVVPQIGRGARYLFPVTESKQALQDLRSL